MVGGDYFCGNGYGTSMLATLGEVTGVDGSDEAIDVAKRHYAASGTMFRQAIFPFSLEPGSHDFIVSLESVEHVPDAGLFLETLTAALKPGGCLIISTPNEDLYPFDPQKVVHHFRHFTIQDVLDICAPLGLDLIASVGQRRNRLRKLIGVAKSAYEFCRSEEGRFVVFAFRKAANV